MSDLPVLDHWVGGAAWPGTSTRTAPVYDPARGEAQREVRLAGADDVAAAVASATAAAPAWRDASLAKRQGVMFAFREILNARKEELARILTSEHGKVLADAHGEIARGLEVVEFACAAPHLLKGEYSESVSTGVDVYTLRQPLGVVGVISPFNFPAMVPLWFVPIALAAGNAVVLKPSEKDPSAANWIAERYAEAGLPAGVLSVVHGDKEAVDAILEHPDIASVSFVGSTPIAKYIYETASAHGKRVQALGGAKNHMLVLPDADLDLAAERLAVGRRDERGALEREQQLGQQRRHDQQHFRSPCARRPRTGVNGAGGGSWLSPGLVSTTHREQLRRIGQPGGYCGIGYLDGRHLPQSMRGHFAVGVGCYQAGLEGHPEGAHHRRRGEVPGIGSHVDLGVDRPPVLAGRPGGQGVGQQPDGGSAYVLLAEPRR